MVRITIGTRGSNLALAQTELVAQALRHHHPDLYIDIKTIKTTGDKRLDLALDTSGDKGLFTRAIEQEILDKHIDIAVHSLKDLPIAEPEGLTIACILPRERVEDVLVGYADLDALPQGAIVGTSSPRRRVQLLVLRPDLDIRPIRGNVETRLRRLHEGHFDALIMARAGLLRLGLEREIGFILPENIMVPAPAQGAIAIQCLTSRPDLDKLLRPLHCTRTEQEVNTEREILNRLGGGCALPLGCVCHIDGARYSIIATYLHEQRLRHAEINCSEEDRELGIQHILKTLQDHD